MDFLKIKNERRNALITEQTPAIAARDAKNVELDAFASTLDTESRGATTDEEVLVKIAFDELRSMTDAIEVRQAEITGLDDEIATLERSAKSYANIPAMVRGSGKTDIDDVYDIELRTAARTTEVRRDVEERAKRIVEADDSLTDEQRDLLDSRLRNTSINKGGALARHLVTTGRPAYRSAFAKMVRMDGGAYLTPEEAAAVDEVRAMEIGTDSEGGFLVPFILDPTVILANAGRVNPMRELATVRTVAADNWQGVTSAGVTASWDDEEGEVSDDSPTFAQPAIPVRTPKAFIMYSVEAEDDITGLATDATMMLNDAKDDLEAAGFTLGTGSSNQPTGLVTGLVAASSIVTSAGTDAYAVADVYALQNDLPSRYEANATWQMNKSVINLTRQFGTADSHAMLSHLGDGQPPQLLGDSLYKNSSLDGSITADAANYVAVYGDIARAYRINDRIGLTVERVPHLFGGNGRPTGQRGWFARWRVGAGIVDGNAARVLNVT